MPTGHRVYDYSALPARAPLEWPDGARIAVWIGLNIEHYTPDVPAMSVSPVTASLKPDPLNHGWRDYGPRVGIWRVIDVLDRFGIRATALVNSDACLAYPEIVAAGNEREWAWVAHGKTNSSLWTGMEADEERALLEDVVAVIERETGRRPRGWLGPALTETHNTPRLLGELGFRYVLDWCADDQPFALNVDGASMCSVPYTLELGDVTLLLIGKQSGAQFAQTVIDQFDCLYEEGRDSARVLCLSLHPFVIGHPFRKRYLEQALEHITARPGVWWTTSDEIADWYLDRQDGR